MTSLKNKVVNHLTWTSSYFEQMFPYLVRSRQHIFSVVMKRNVFFQGYFLGKKTYDGQNSGGVRLWLTFFLSGSSRYFLERILVRSRLLISGCSFAYLALFSIKKRKYGVKGFLGKSGCFCICGRERGTELLKPWTPLTQLVGHKSRECCLEFTFIFLPLYGFFM